MPIAGGAILNASFAALKTFVLGCTVCVSGQLFPPSHEGPPGPSFSAANGEWFAGPFPAPQFFIPFPSIPGL